MSKRTDVGAMHGNRVFDFDPQHPELQESMTVITDQSPRTLLNSDRLRSAKDEYRDCWALTDQELYRLCRKYPRHDDRAAVNAKLLIVGRSYATGIERQIPSSGSQGSSLAQLAGHLVEQAQLVDDLIQSLPAALEVLSEDLLEPVLEIHSRFVQLLQQVTRDDETPRTFAAKYLHFHRPVVPIFDNVANDFIPKLIRWRKNLEVVPCQAIFDWTYYRYVMRFWNLFEQVRAMGNQLTTKELDYFVLCVAGYSWTEASD